MRAFTVMPKNTQNLILSSDGDSGSTNGVTDSSVIQKRLRFETILSIGATIAEFKKEFKKAKQQIYLKNTGQNTLPLEAFTNCSVEERSLAC